MATEGNGSFGESSRNADSREAGYALGTPGTAFQSLEEEPFAYGEPYPAPPTYRFVSMALSGSMGGPLDGDRYGGFLEADEVCKGYGALQEPISSGMKCDWDLPVPTYGGLERCSCGYANEPLPSPWAPLEMPSSGSEQLAREANLQTSAQETAFAKGSCPPSLPQHPFFQLCLTAFFVRLASPADLGNALLSFLREELGAETVKVRGAKFTAKTEVHCDEGVCTVKLRVYDLGDGRLAVEVQRRHGDAVAFASVFQRLKEYLDQRFSLEEPATGLQEPMFDIPAWGFEPPAIPAY